MYSKNVRVRAGLLCGFPTLTPRHHIGAGGCGFRAHCEPIPRVGSYYTYGIVDGLGWVY